MSLGFPETLRNAQLDAVTAAADAGAGPALLRVYDPGPSFTGRPVPTGDPVTDQVLLVEIICADPFAPAASGGQLLPTIPATATILADGTATWFRVVDSDGTFVMDGDVGSDMVITDPALINGEPFDINTWTIFASNG